MKDLYHLLEKQEYSEVGFGDGTSLVIRYNSGNRVDQLHSAEWCNRDLSKPMPPYAQYIYQGKTARIAITAAIQVRYPE